MVLVIGKKLKSDGSLTSGYIAQITKVTQMLQKCQTMFVVISGGVSRSKYHSVARAGLERIPMNLRDRVLLEEQALSTQQSIKYTRELVQDRSVTKIVVVGSTAHSFRVEYLFWKYWPGAKHVLWFSPAYSSSIWERLFEITALGMTSLDSNEKFFFRIKRALLD